MSPGHIYDWTHGDSTLLWTRATEFPQQLQKTSAISAFSTCPSELTTSENPHQGDRPWAEISSRGPKTPIPKNTILWQPMPLSCHPDDTSCLPRQTLLSVCISLTRFTLNNWDGFRETTADFVTYSFHVTSVSQLLMTPS